MKEALYDVPLYREFAGLDGGMVRLPDESTILLFRHLLETHGLAAQMLALVNEWEATMIASGRVASRNHVLPGNCHFPGSFAMKAGAA